MKIETKRLILRKPKLSDWGDIVEGIGDLKVSSMQTMTPYPYKKNDAISFIQSRIDLWNKKIRTDYFFVIELKSEKKVIGVIEICKVDKFWGTGETGSWINKKYWRNGYITEAKIAINDFAFNKINLRRLDSEVFKDNIASNKTQIKMGYILEGTKRKAKKSKDTGKIHDLNIYGLLKEDWVKKRKKLMKN